MKRDKRSLVKMVNIDGVSVIKKIDGRLEEFETTLHYHNYIEANVILGGRTYHEINGETREATRGYAFIVLPHDYHTYHTAEDEKVEIYNVRFYEKWISHDVLTMLTLNKQKLETQLSDEDTCRITALYDLMMMEQEKKDEYFEITMSRLLDYTIMLVLRNISEDLSAGNNDIVKQALSCIEKHFRETDFSLNSISDELNKTPNYIGSLLRISTNMTFPKYLNKRRLIYAERLLRENILSIQEVAVKSGFNSTSYFIKQFRQMYGLSPKAYLENYSQQNELK